MAILDLIPTVDRLNVYFEVPGEGPPRLLLHVTGRRND